MAISDRFVHALVEETPGIDVHSHQGTNGVWQARDLWEILSYHWLATDLRCAGCPSEVFKDPNLDSRERVRRAAAYSAATRNTCNHWCFMNIARDLYGFAHPHLDEGNWEWLFDAVAERVGDPQWEAHVLQQGRIEMASAAYSTPPRLPNSYFAYEYGEYLFAPGLGRPVSEALQKLGGVDSASALCNAIDARIRQLHAEHNVRALHVWAPITWTYSHVEAAQADLLLHKAQASAHLTPEEQDQLASFGADCTAQVCGELGIVIQLFLGAMTMETGGPYVSMSRPEWLRALVPLFSAHPQTPFDLFLATRPISHEATVLARNYPNLWVSGAWWQAFTPSTLSEFFRDRLEMLPLNKWNAFYSDGYCVEWVFGKSTLSRNRLAVALGEVLEEGLISRDVVEDMARAVLYENPRRLYLGGGAQ